MNWINFPDDRLKVYGLAWFKENKPSLCRLPIRLKDTFRPPVWDLAQDPAGGRIRFRTDSTFVGIKAKSPDSWVMNHITRIGQSGFDVYVDNYFMGSVSPDDELNIKAEWHIAAKPKMRDITIHMPLYKSVTIESIGIDDNAKIEPPSQFALDKPVLFYGTSITQGGCADTPGTSYQNFISRWLNVDFINLGFSGNGLGEPELAVAIGEVDCSCIVIDHWANKDKDYKKNLPEFIGPIRENHPKIPIIVVAPFYFTNEETDPELHQFQRDAAESFVKKMNFEGDKAMYCFDGRKMISRETGYGLVDGVHATSLGFYFIAKGFTPFLKKVLDL